MSRAGMTAAERDWRSRLAQIVHRDPLMRGSLSVRHVTCGKRNCRCAKGEKHLALYLTYSKDGKTHQVYIPQDMEKEARQWVGNYHKVRGLLERVTEQAWENLKSRRT
jgi:hypothetical protein